MDEIGVPFAETTDYGSLEDDTVKIREKGQQSARQDKNQPNRRTADEMVRNQIIELLRSIVIVQKVYPEPTAHLGLTI